MTDEEIALNLTKIINDNINENSNHYLNEKWVIETYKRVLKEIRKDDKKEWVYDKRTRRSNKHNETLDRLWKRK